MAITAIKRVANWSAASVALLDIENPNVRGHGVQIRSDETITVDMWVPWAGHQEDFPQHHLELQSDGRTRFWIWQAANADGDYVRFSTDGAWRDRGERVFGQPAVDGDRMIVVLDDFILVVPYVGSLDVLPPVTAIKRIENRSRLPVTLLDIENSNAPGHGVEVRPFQTLAVEMWIPWAPNASVFPQRHLQLQADRKTRFWIWQAAQADGDFVRFSTDAAWHDQGQRVNGNSSVGILLIGADRTLVVLDDRFELVDHPLATAIRTIENRSRATVRLLDVENPNAPGHGTSIAPGNSLAVDMLIPWAPRAEDFPQRRLELQLNGQTRFWIWQAAYADDLVRFSKDGAWHDRGQPVHGLAVVEGERTLVVQDECFDLVDFSSLRPILADLHREFDAGRFRLSDTQPNPHPDGIPSVPNKSTVAFSMAGVPSDTYDRRQPGARFLYRDSGKRYDYEIRDGVVWASWLDAVSGQRVQWPLRDACSFSSRRAGVRIAAPPFDMIAASGGRVLAKERGADRFYFAMMDHSFIHFTPERGEFPVPPIYSRLDPEFHQPTARNEDLTAHLAGCFEDHYAAERFPAYRFALEQGFTDMMMVRLDRRIWHLIDTRPPLGLVSPKNVAFEAFLRTFTTTLPPIPGPIQDAFQNLLGKLPPAFDRFKEALQAGTTGGTAPPTWVPRVENVAYSDGSTELKPLSIDYRKVLDIGVGAMHLHDQYEVVVGGEVQPMRTGTLTDFWKAMYAFFNGPIRDADGYNDGTVHYYALVQLKDNAAVGIPDAYGIVYCDEQFYFTQRWRLVHHEDNNGLQFAVAASLEWPLSLQYGWNPQTYWCPLRAGHIGPDSRMAVARQVVLVTGMDPATRAGEIYSINFSWGTIDRSWRWRPLPAPSPNPPPTDAEALEETILVRPGQPECVYPQTIGLREDMTIHLKGTSEKAGQAATVGRWYQRYLPATNRLEPPSEQLLPNVRPQARYGHLWKFLPEAAFRRADQFSHFGVYDQVDSRTQYYVVEPASNSDADRLTAGGPGPWIDERRQLFVLAGKFRYAAPSRPDIGIRRPPSMFNPETRLRIVPRGVLGWIAMHWDKRDDDLVPFSNLLPLLPPATVELTNGTQRARVTLRARRWVEEPPVVRSVEFAWTGLPNATAVITLTTPQNQRKLDDERAAWLDQDPDRLVFENVWRVRMAAFDASGTVVSLFDATTDVRFARTSSGSWVCRWTPTAGEVASLRSYCSPVGALVAGTSIWFEDVVGHVSVPEQLRWSTPMRVTVAPAEIPYGISVQVTVHVEDAFTSAVLAGTVTIDGQPVGKTDRAFAYTFTRRTTRVYDAETKQWLEEEVAPAGAVVVAEWAEGFVPFSCYQPTLRIVVEPASIPAGPPGQVTIRAVDARTGAPVAGRVKIGGQDVAGTNVPFTYAFSPGITTGVVSATGYPDAPVRFPLYAPRQIVWVEPSTLWIGRAMQVTVRSVDQTTGAPVTGRVIVNNQDVAAINTPFTYTFTTPPAGAVRATYYPETTISWPPLRQPGLVVAIQPYPVQVETTTTYTVSARDMDTQAAVDGAVKVNGVEVARTNVQFAYRFIVRKVRVFDPETRTYTDETIPPVGVVSAPGYSDTQIGLGV